MWFVDAADGSFYMHQEQAKTYNFVKNQLCRLTYKWCNDDLSKQRMYL